MMSKLEKKSLKPSLFFITAFFLFSEIWDILIYLLFPDRPRELTNLAVVIMHPASTSEILLTIIFTVVFILLFSLALAWLLRKLGADDEFFGRQRLWLWILAGVILSLMEFQEVLGRFWSNVLVLLLLIGLGFVYIKIRESRQDEISTPS